MGIGDSLNSAKDKAKGYAEDNPDKVDSTLEKGEGAAADRVPDQHSDKVSKGFDSARDKVGGEGNEGKDQQGG